MKRQSILLTENVQRVADAHYLGGFEAVASLGTQMEI